MASNRPRGRPLAPALEQALGDEPAQTGPHLLRRLPARLGDGVHLGGLDRPVGTDHAEHQHPGRDLDGRERHDRIVGRPADLVNLAGLPRRESVAEPRPRRETAGMSTRSYLLDEATDAYVRAHSEPADEVYDWLVEQTAALGDWAGMQIGYEQGVFLTVLTRLAETAFAVEVGTFTGTSAMCIARGLVPSGRLICCDVSEEWTSIARQAWVRAGLDDRIELAIAPAIETLRSLPDDPIIDLAFVDADKTGYPDYYEELVPRLRARRPPAGRQHAAGRRRRRPGGDRRVRRGDPALQPPRRRGRPGHHRPAPARRRHHDEPEAVSRQG